MTVREVKKEDLQGLLLLYTHLHDNPIPQLDGKIQGLWEEILQSPHYHIVVAAQGEELLASCTLVVIPNLTHGQRPYGLIENVVTHPDHRRKGLGTACLDFAKGIALKNRCYKLMLLTGSKKEGTLTFYRRAGYQMGEKTGFVQWLP